jgi:hypothetical protein
MFSFRKSEMDATQNEVIPADYANNKYPQAYQQLHP